MACIPIRFLVLAVNAVRVAEYTLFESEGGIASAALA